MTGFSIFLNESIDQKVAGYIETMAINGFSGVFTSAHIPEETLSDTITRLHQLGNLCKRYKMELMVDISGDILEKMGFSENQPDKILDIGITGLRMDYGITFKTMAKLSQKLKIALNASTIKEDDIVQLKKYQAHFDNLEAWHNYYPRPETGLDYDYFLTKNSWLKQQNFTVVAFVPGDNQLRGPIYTGLPTLENHRYKNPFVSSLELTNKCNVDLVYIGDPSLNSKTINQFSIYHHENAVLMRVTNLVSEYTQLILSTYHNRLDEAQWVIRLEESRIKNQGKIIKAEHQIVRNKGSITIDNQLYKRYMGEMQITKVNLPQDEGVNVIGKIIVEDLELLNYISGGQKIKLQLAKSISD